MKRGSLTSLIATHEFAWDLVMGGLTVVYVVAAFVDDRRAEGIVNSITLTLAAVFAIEFGARFLDAPSRREYLRNHWLDIVTCIPMVGPLRVFRLLRVVRLMRLLKSSRSVALHLGTRRTGRPTMESWMIAPTLILLWVSSAGGFWLLERGVNPSVTTFGDALYLSFITATTVGYSSVRPVTIEGQVLAGMIIFVGLGLLGFTSSRLTAYWLLQSDGANELANEVKDLRADLLEVKAMLGKALVIVGEGVTEELAVRR